MSDHIFKYVYNKISKTNSVSFKNLLRCTLLKSSIMDKAGRSSSARKRKENKKKQCSLPSILVNLSQIQMVSHNHHHNSQRTLAHKSHITISTTICNFPTNNKNKSPISSKKLKPNSAKMNYTKIFQNIFCCPF